MEGRDRLGLPQEKVLPVQSDLDCSHNRLKSHERSQSGGSRDDDTRDGGVDDRSGKGIGSSGSGGHGEGRRWSGDGIVALIPSEIVILQ
jgi:hypothetical protein